jgi:transcriptional regulator with XRE-family HTH domain
MLTATLGGFIKDHRLKKRLSQLELSHRIGWSDATRLSKIEQGRVGRPNRETLQKIMDALDLDSHQQGEMLLVGAGVPSRKERIEVLSKLSDEAESLKYPVLVTDIYWTTCFVNEQFKEIWDLSDEAFIYINNSNPNWMELLFLTDYLNNVDVMGGVTKKDLRPFKEYQIAHFKRELQNSFSETWFLKLIQNLKTNPEFEDLWSKIPQLDVNSQIWHEYEYNSFTYHNTVNPYSKSYHICSIRPNFDSRFYYMIHIPE